MTDTGSFIDRLGRPANPASGGGRDGEDSPTRQVAGNASAETTAPGAKDGRSWSRPGQTDVARRYAGRILPVLERLGWARGSVRDAFEDWLALTEKSLLTIPARARLAWEGTQFEDTDETKTLFARCMDRYGRKGMAGFAEMTGLLMEAASQDYADVLGSVFMEVGANGRDQFFTPMTVARMMARMNDTEGLLHERLTHAIHRSPAASAYLLSGLALEGERLKEAHLIANVIPAAIGHYDPVRVCDPCCGSGVLFIAEASCLPSWMTRLGLVRFEGIDLDPRCVRMTHINMMLYGLNGFMAEEVVLRAAAHLADPRSWTHPGTEEPVRPPAAIPLETARARARQLGLFAEKVSAAVTAEDTPSLKAA